MRKFLILILLSLLLIVFDQLGVIRPIRGLIEKLVLPIESRLYSPKQQTPNLELERKIAVLEAEISTLKKENADIRRLLGAPLPSNWKFLPAKIIGKEDGVLLLDKGRSDGLTLGEVAVFENLFVGQISSLGEHICRLETLESPSLKIQVIVKNPSSEGVNAQGILSNIGGRLILDRLLPEEQVQEGDLVLTTSPPDLLVGKIIKVNPPSGGQVFQKAEIKSLISYSELENVFLVVFR